MPAPARDLGCCLFALLALLAHRVSAAPPELDPAFFQAIVSAVGEETQSIDDGPGSVAIEAGAFTGHATTTGGALPTVSADCETIRIVGGADADVSFQFAVEQLVAGEPIEVPILVHTRGEISATHAGGGAALGRIAAGIQFVGNNPNVEARACSPVTCAGDVEGGFDTTLAVSIPPWPGPSSVGVLSIDIDLSCFPGLDGASSISGFVDPLFEIDPAFERRDEFRLAFGAGVSPVPEPSAAFEALALTAFAVVRKRRRSRRGVA